MKDTVAAYLAGYLERGGAIRIYVNKIGEDLPVIETSQGETSPIESAGIYVRVRAQDPTVPRMLKGIFDSTLSIDKKQWQWQGWNDDAAALLRVIVPYLRAGKRKAVANLALEFHTFMERKRENAMGSVLFFTVEDVGVVTGYEVALKEITGSR